MPLSQLSGLLLQRYLYRKKNVLCSEVCEESDESCSVWLLTDTVWDNSTGHDDGEDSIGGREVSARNQEGEQLDEDKIRIEKPCGCC